MRFSKYHGCLNDFIVVESALDAGQAAKLCDRHAGIGADGVAVVSFGGPDNLPTMRIYNADGSQPEMCGNALRCVVKHLVPRLGRPPWRVQTDAGIMVAWMAGDDVVVDMGPPRKPVERLDVSVQNRTFSGYTTSMGNPHFVIESSEPMREAECFGRSLSIHPTFSEGCNISFVRWVSPTQVDSVVFERGAGLTMACGTGACAIATVGWHLGKLTKGQEVSVQLPGGRLAIDVSREKPGHLVMRGPAVRVFDGEIQWQPFSS